MSASAARRACFLDLVPYFFAAHAKHTDSPSPNRLLDETVCIVAGQRFNRWLQSAAFMPATVAEQLGRCVTRHGIRRNGAGQRP